MTSIERFKDKKVLLVGGNESIGVPCAVYGKNKKGFMEIVADYLKENEITVDMINMFSMFVNKNWHIDEILKHNLTLEEIKNMKKASIVINRKDFFNKLFLPKSLENLDKVKKSDDKLHVTDLMKSYENVVTFYQSGSNNLMYEMQASPINSVLDKNMRSRALEEMNDARTINKVISGMDKNINNLLSINNDMELYVLSLYVPKLFSKLSKHNDEFKIMVDFINRFNDSVRDLANSNMVNYIDISSVGEYCAKFGMDFHCTSKGHEHLARLVLNSMDNNHKGMIIPNRKLEIDNMGLDGMLKEAFTRLDSYEKAKQNDAYENTILSSFSDSEQKQLCDSLIKEHSNEIEVFKLAQNLKYK